MSARQPFRSLILRRRRDDETSTENLANRGETEGQLFSFLGQLEYTSLQTPVRASGKGALNHVSGNLAEGVHRVDFSCTHFSSVVRIKK